MDLKAHFSEEQVREENYVIASYYIKLPAGVDPYRKAQDLAVGQTIGTWVPIPGITDEIRAKYMGKVVSIFDIPPCELTPQEPEDGMNYLFRIAYPAANFGSDFPLMLTSLLGNDASTSAQVKLLDITFPEEYAKRFQGPLYGIDGIRESFGIEKRPLLLNMIKPCTGISPEAGARIFKEAAAGGADIIKDDELFGNPDYSSPAARVKAYKQAAKEAEEETGHRTRYFVNITSGAGEITEVLKQAEEAVKYSDVHRKESFEIKEINNDIIEFQLGAGGFTATGDVRIEFFQMYFLNLKSDKLFKVWFNTNFVPQNGVYEVKKEAIDKACKDLTCKVFNKDFKIDIEYFLY